MECTDVKQLARRKQLELWRKRTGRTPMKRLSYVKECWRGDKPHPLHRTVTKPKPAPSTASMENMPPQSAVRSEKPKMPRREMLEKWLQTHGNTVKKPRSYLPQDSKQKPRATPKPRPRRHTLASLQLKGGCLTCREEDERAAMKELFQKDIEDTIAEVYSDPISKQLEFDFDDLPGDDIVVGTTYGEMASQQLSDSTHMLHSNIDYDERLIFRSTAIRYSTALTEPRRKRRHSSAVTPNSKRILCLTPVRRSTRKSRNWNGPGVELDKSMCFDSPSNAVQPGHQVEIQIIPNKALVFDI